MAMEEYADPFTTIELKTLEKLVFTDDRIKFLNETFTKSDEAYWYFLLLTYQAKFGSSLTKESKVLAGSIDKVQKVDGLKGNQNIQNVLLRQAIINFEKCTKAVKRQTIDRLRELIMPNLELQQDTVASHGRAKPQAYPTSIDISTNSLLSSKWNKFNLDKRKDIGNVF